MALVTLRVVLLEKSKYVAVISVLPGVKVFTKPVFEIVAILVWLVCHCNFLLLRIIGLSRSISLRGLFHNLILFPLNFSHSLIKTYSIFNKFKPNIVIGTGGYSSAIPLFVAFLKGIKIAIQEQNSIPGLVNKIFSKKAEKVFFGFEPEESKNIDYLVLGNPTIKNNKNFSKDIKNNNQSNLQTKIVDTLVKKNPFTIFILGGSQGSVPINNHFLNHYKEYIEKGIRLIWQYGANNITYIKSQIHSRYVERIMPSSANIDLHCFINEIEKYYLESDLIISRAGALTLTEISNYGKASILIPYPFAANNHQLSNANFYKKKGACEIVNQSQLKEGLLENKVKEMINDKDIIENMEKNVSLLSKPNAAENIVKEILKICSIRVK